MKQILIVFIYISATSYSQHYKMHPNIKQDTTYSIDQRYRNNKKEYPFITPITEGDTSLLKIHHNIVYRRYDGRDMHLDISYLKKKAKEKLPVVILVHGGGWRSGDKSMQAPMAYELARNGFATVNVEYRLSMEALYPAGMIDIKTAIRWVKTNTNHFPIDTNRIALLGCSSGGQMVSLLGSINGPFEKYEPDVYNEVSDQVHAVVDIDGVLAFIHPESGEGNDKPGRPSAATLYFGSTVTEDSLVRHEASALTHVNENSAKFLYICSSLPRFHAGRNEMIAKMNDYCIYTEVKTIPDTPHTIWLFHPWYDSVVVKIIEFLNDNI